MFSPCGSLKQILRDLSIVQISENDFTEGSINLTADCWLEPLNQAGFLFLTSCELRDRVWYFLWDFEAYSANQVTWMHLFALFFSSDLYIRHNAFNILCCQIYWVFVFYFFWFPGALAFTASKARRLAGNKPAWLSLFWNSAFFGQH